MPNKDGSPNEITHSTLEIAHAQKYTTASSLSVGQVASGVYVLRHKTVDYAADISLYIKNVQF